MSSLKIIKTIVFILTFFLLAGLITLSLLISKRVGKNSEAISPQINLEQEKGSTIEQISSNQKFLYILVKNQEMSDRVVVFDNDEQKVITTIHLN